mmetsp:Transcript_64633/g.189088  ORF Transcript_64633/g.189088 Transcript_64633/m.189088 type:complete len:210 (-) Transcript_64633:639-1268(-)
MIQQLLVLLCGVTHQLGQRFAGLRSRALHPLHKGLAALTVACTRLQGVRDALRSSRLQDLTAVLRASARELLQHREGIEQHVQPANLVQLPLRTRRLITHCTQYLLDHPGAEHPLFAALTVHEAGQVVFQNHSPHWSLPVGPHGQHPPLHRVAQHHLLRDFWYLAHHRQEAVRTNLVTCCVVPGGGVVYLIQGPQLDQELLVPYIEIDE